MGKQIMKLKIHSLQIIVIVSIIILILLLFPRHAKLRCSDFNDRGQAQEALLNGQTQLDRDHDGYACEEIQ